MHHTTGTKICIFIDGAHLYAIDDYYRGVNANHEWHLNWRNFMYFLRSMYAKEIGMDVSDVSIAESHLFLGINEPDADMMRSVLGTSGIRLHPSPRRLSHEKLRDSFGADVGMAVYALEHAYKNSHDAVVLFTGNSAFMPLAFSLKRAGKKVILPYWGQLGVKGEHQYKIITSSSLIRAADIAINMPDKITNPGEDAELLTGILTKVAWLPELEPKKLIQVQMPVPKNPKRPTGVKLRGVIVGIANNIGYIRPKDATSNAERMFFHSWKVEFDKTRFDDLKEGMEVEYECYGNKPKQFKRLAINVRVAA